MQACEWRNAFPLGGRGGTVACGTCWLAAAQSPALGLAASTQAGRARPLVPSQPSIPLPVLRPCPTPRPPPAELDRIVLKDSQSHRAFANTSTCRKVGAGAPRGCGMSSGGASAAAEQILAVGRARGPAAAHPAAAAARTLLMPWVCSVQRSLRPAKAVFFTRRRACRRSSPPASCSWCTSCAPSGYTSPSVTSSTQVGWGQLVG